MYIQTRADVYTPRVHHTHLIAHIKPHSIGNARFVKNKLRLSNLLRETENFMQTRR